MITAQKRSKNPKSGSGSGTGRWNRKKNNSNAKKAAAIRVARPGYPKTLKFENTQQVQDYMEGDRITCLLCGRYFRALGQHLIRIHETTPDTYRKRYGIPWSYGLTCTESKEIQRMLGKEKYQKTGHKFLTPGVPPNTRRRTPQSKVRTYYLEDFQRMLSLMVEQERTLKEVYENNPGLPHPTNFHYFARNHPDTKLKDEYRTAVGKLPPAVQIRSRAPISWCVSFLEALTNLKDQGLNEKYIADSLNVSPTTIKRHLRGFH